MLVMVSNSGRMPNHYFSDTELHLKVRNILSAPIQKHVALIAHSSSRVTLQAQTGQGYLVAGSGFGCTSPDIWRSKSSGFVVTGRSSSAATN